MAADGKLVYESYADGHAREQKYEMDSALKTMNALMFGVAVTKGLVDIDKTLASYDVTPKANWSKSGTDYYSKVTSRHVLTQTTGVGYYPPGSQFTYDSDEYIQHLSYVLAKRTNESPQTWATKTSRSPLASHMRTITTDIWV